MLARVVETTLPRRLRGDVVLGFRIRELRGAPGAGEMPGDANAATDGDPTLRRRVGDRPRAWQLRSGDLGFNGRGASAGNAVFQPRNAEHDLLGHVRDRDVAIELHFGLALLKLIDAE